MPNELQTHVILQDNPYLDDDPGAMFEVWSRFVFVISTNGVRRVLVDWEWDMAPLAAWFTSYHAALRHEELKVMDSSPAVDESIAQAMSRFYDHDFADDEEAQADQWFDALFEYRMRHSLRSALPGAAIADIFIGCNRGVGEISLADQANTWSYQFDMERFCGQLRSELLHALSSWLSTASVDGAHITEQLTRLQAVGKAQDSSIS